MTETWTARNAAEVYQAVREALASGLTLEVTGSGTRRDFGRPMQTDVVIDTSGLRGVVSYQPEELVLTVLPGTPMQELSDLLADRRQQFAFEPPEMGRLWGRPGEAGTIGGCAMVGLGGPRRLTAGGPRDHCLGVKGVNGFGDPYAAGGRVVKNVTGFDLPKLMTGSFGVLSIITELTFKVLPAAPQSATLVLVGLGEDAAMKAMSQALASPAQVSSAAHLPQDVAAYGEMAGIAGASATIIRLEGVVESVGARVCGLAALFGRTQQLVLGDGESRALWDQVRDAAFLGADLETVIWKLSVAPGLGAAVGERIKAAVGGRCFYDWGGGSIWLELPPSPTAHAADVRAALAEVAAGDGHATLVRAPPEVRASVSPFQPLEPGLGALTRRVKQQFDPRAIFNPGRMYEGL